MQMKTNTRWMPASELAERFQVHPNAVRHAYSNEGTCNGFQIRRRKVRDGEDFGRCQYVFRGIDGTPERRPAPVTDKPPEPKTETSSTAPDESRSPARASSSHVDSKGSEGQGDPGTFMRQDDLAQILGCAVKSVRGAWARDTSLKGHRIERRPVGDDEDFGRVSFVFRALPFDSDSDAPDAGEPNEPVVLATDEPDSVSVPAPDSPSPEAQNPSAAQSTGPDSQPVDIHTLLSASLTKATQYCLEHPEDATPVFRFLRSLSNQAADA